MRRPAWIAASAVAAFVVTGCMPRQPWTTDLVSVDPDGTASGTGQSGYSSTGSGFDVSSDGTHVVFMSEAGNLVAGDDNGTSDIFLRDLTTGTTTLVTAAADGSGSADGESYDPRFSSDGTKLLFRSNAGDLGPRDTNGSWDIYVKDLVADTMTLVSVNSAGTDSGNGYSYRGSFSGDGTKVAFDSYASDLDATHSDTNRRYDVYVRDLVTGTTTLVSVDASGQAAANGSQPTFSPDGTRVAFTSWETGFGPPDSGFDLDLYVRDLATETTAMVTVNAAGTDGGDRYPVGERFSPDGRRIMWSSEATDLVANDTNGRSDVFLRDLTTGTTSLVSHNAAGTASANGSSSGESFSPDGTKVLFTSSANDLGPVDPGTNYDAFIRDLATGETTLVSRNHAGTGGGNGHVHGAAFNADGTMVALTATSTDLIPYGPEGQNVYVVDLATGAITMASPDAEGTDGGNGGSSDPRFVHGSRRVVFLSGSSNLDPRDTNSAPDIYISTYEAADLRVDIAASPEPVLRGDPLTYTLTADNGGPDPAEATTLAVLLPEGVSFDDATTDVGKCAEPTPHEPRIVQCDLGDTSVGGDATVTITTTVQAEADPSLEALALVTAATVDIDDTDNLVTAESTVTG